jgi:BirA family biotin operon repressor/biotin-[acetyl-CoA-carboxylase] ligase
VPPLALATAVAVADALAESGAEPSVKWPNDLLLDGRKVAGILTEMSTAGGAVQHLVIGIGVNLNVRAFPEGLHATSLALATGHPADRTAFAASLCNHLEPWYERFVAGGVVEAMAAWRRRATLLGQPVTVSHEGGALHGVAEDVEDDGSLRLRLDDGRAVRIRAGEIS